MDMCQPIILIKRGGWRELNFELIETIKNGVYYSNELDVRGLLTLVGVWMKSNGSRGCI